MSANSAPIPLDAISDIKLDVKATDSKATDNKATDVKAKDEKDSKQSVVSEPTKLVNPNDENAAKLAYDPTDPNIDKLITLKSNDGKEIRVPVKNAYISNFIKTVLSQDTNAHEIKLELVSGKVLDLVVEYMNIHKGVIVKSPEKPLRSREMKDVTDLESANFIDKVGTDPYLLYDLSMCANYLIIPQLLDLASAKVAALIKGKPIESIKEILDPKSCASQSAAKANENKVDAKVAAAQ
jgi:hypothetical protein